MCFIVGNACQASAFAHLPEVFEGRPRAFALIYTLGNTVAIGGCASLLLTPAPLRQLSRRWRLSDSHLLGRTCFLWGPKAQWKGMTDPKRVVSALGYLATLGATLVSALLIQSPPITIGCAVAQFVIGVYYELSYCPGWLTRGGRWLIGWCCR